MKRALLTLALVAVVAGTASAAMFVPPSGPEARRAKPTMSLEARTVSDDSRNEPSKPLQPVAMETGRSPVPLLRQPKAPTQQWALATDQPRGDAHAALPVTPAVADQAESAAKSAILADGYKQVRSMTRGADGRWTARVLRGKTEIGITIEPDGSVRAD